MDTCPYSLQLSAYHDGELSEAQRRQVEQHLESACPACAAELQQWQRLSSLLASAPALRLPVAAREELYKLAPVVREAGFIRLAEWTTALAASVMIAASAWLVVGHKAVAPTSVTAPTQVADNSWVPIFKNPNQNLDTVADAGSEAQFSDWVVTNLEQ
ncbi:MAG TPA: zf-HC2 domain-containing protein [Tepidisphaeraceae bacterium]|nr:zf-HC2 domain-containing protein [Tepidisphaeraceae bacterium]